MSPPARCSRNEVALRRTGQPRAVHSLRRRARVNDSVRPAEPQLVIITGMSSAGRSTAADVLEDLGWYVVDNLPPQLLTTMLELTTGDDGGFRKLAAVVDVRSRTF